MNDDRPTADLHYVQPYSSPLGPMTLAAVVGRDLPEGGALIGAWFDGQAHDRAGVPEQAVILEPPGEPPREGAGGPEVLLRARAWLDVVFAGGDPGEPPALAPRGTAFQQQVWDELRTIPRGTTRTYGQIAQALAVRTGRRTSARAVGGAVGRNPLSVLVPCHRVLGVGGSLTGYAGGPRRKAWLLRSEGVSVPGVQAGPEELPGL